MFMGYMRAESIEKRVGFSSNWIFEEFPIARPSIGLQI